IRVLLRCSDFRCRSGDGIGAGFRAPAQLDSGRLAPRAQPSGSRGPSLRSRTDRMDTGLLDPGRETRQESDRRSLAAERPPPRRAVLVRRMIIMALLLAVVFGG